LSKLKLPEETTMLFAEEFVDHPPCPDKGCEAVISKFSMRSWALLPMLITSNATRMTIVRGRWFMITSYDDDE
jgi:hypothetical protein